MIQAGSRSRQLKHLEMFYDSVEIQMHVLIEQELRGLPDTAYGITILYEDLNTKRKKRGHGCASFAA